MLRLLFAILCFTAAAEVQVIPAARQASHLAVIDITGPIDDITLYSIDRRLRAAQADGADRVLLRLNTPGGAVDAMLKICHHLKQKSPLPITAWVDPEAYSAGAIIALATDEIIMAPGSRIGDAAPIVGLPIAGLIDLPATERAKIEAPMLAEVVDSARRNNYDEKLVQSFVSVRFALWELQRNDTRERLLVDANEYQQIFGEAPPVTRGRGAAPAQASRAPALGAETQHSVDIVQEFVTQRTRPEDINADEWHLVGQLVGDEELLVLTETDSIRLGLSAATVGDLAAARKRFGATQVSIYKESWSEALARFLTSWPVRIVLIVVFILALFLELAAPGMGVFGLLAAVAIVILIGAPMLVGLADWWDVLFILLGLTLIGVEVIVTPGIGAIGALGAVSLLVGLAGLFVTADFGTQQANDQVTTALAAIIGALFFGSIGAWWIARRSGGFWILKRMVLDAQSAVPTTGSGMSRAQASSIPKATGRTVFTVTDLRPSGRIELDGTPYAARSVTGWVDRGAAVRILREFAGEYEVEQLPDANDNDRTNTS